MRHNVSWIKLVHRTLFPKLGCSCRVQRRSLPGALGAQKQGEAGGSHLDARLHRLPYPTWRRPRTGSVSLCVLMTEMGRKKRELTLDANMSSDIFLVPTVLPLLAVFSLLHIFFLFPPLRSSLFRTHVRRCPL